MKKLCLILTLMLVITIGSLAQIEVSTIPLNDTIKIELNREIFRKENHTIKYINDTDLLIDNQIVFGTDGVVPKFSLKSAVIKIGEREIKLETSSMFNPWFGHNPNPTSFGAMQDGTHLKIKGLFSDGAGTYGTEWIIIGNSSVRTILTYDEQILYEYLNY